MTNWALRDFEKEGITGQFIRFAHGDGGGPVIEVRLSRARHFQFVVWCPDCKYSKLLPTKFKAKRSLFRHLRTHKRRTATNVSSQSEQSAIARAGEHRSGEIGAAGPKRKDVWKTRSKPALLGSLFPDSDARDKESSRKAGRGHANNDARTACHVC